jgi:hypothetical protein
MKYFGAAANTITPIAILSKRGMSCQKDGDIEHPERDLIAYPALTNVRCVAGYQADVWIHSTSRDVRDHRVGMSRCDAHQSHRLEAVGQRRVLHPGSPGEPLKPQPATPAERSIQRGLLTLSDVNLSQILDKCVIHVAPIGIAGGDLRIRPGNRNGSRNPQRDSAIVKSRGLCYGANGG